MGLEQGDQKENEKHHALPIIKQKRSTNTNKIEKGEKGQEGKLKGKINH
jgi:hypothetical protein